MPPALAGLDVVAVAQTGTGKTLAFLVPMLAKMMNEKGDGELNGDQAVSPNGNDRVNNTRHNSAQPAKKIRSLIMAPTRELALQIAASFEKLAPGTGFRCAVVVGGMSEQKQLNDVRRGAQVVIATPGRLEDYMTRRLIDISGVTTVVLDEADRMLDMGFLPAIEKVLAALPKNRQSLFFSATMDKTVERLIQRNSNSAVQVRITGSSNRTPDQVDLHLYEIETDLRVGLLRHMLTQEEGSFLVFARTKHGTDRLAKRLSAVGIRAVAMHGDRTQNQRNQALAGFRDGRYRVLVATDVAARGIHVDSVAHVVNYDLPQAPEDFIHRVGRTGRAGQRGSASTFSSKSERSEIKRIERECKVSLTRRDFATDVIMQLSETPKREEGAFETPKHHVVSPAPKRFGAPSPNRFGQSGNRPRHTSRGR